MQNFQHPTFAIKYIALITEICNAIVLPYFFLSFTTSFFHRHILRLFYSLIKIYLYSYSITKNVFRWKNVVENRLQSSDFKAHSMQR